MSNSTPISSSDQRPPSYDAKEDGRAHHQWLPQRVSRRVGQTMDLNLVAMIDVVFLLLMYFLLATNFSIGEELFRIDLPQSLGTQAEVDPFDLPEQPVHIRVASFGPGLASCRITVDLAQREFTSFSELYHYLDGVQVRPATATGVLFEQTPIIIHPDPQCRWDHAVDVLNACLRARYTNVQFVEPEI